MSAEEDEASLDVFSAMSQSFVSQFSEDSEYLSRPFALSLGARISCTTIRRARGAGELYCDMVGVHEAHRGDLFAGR
jgi:hypothetical protein